MGLVAAWLVLGSAAQAADRPVITVSRSGAVPPRLEVHVGEVVVWRATSGGTLRVQLDDHRGAHEVAEGVREVVGVFRRAGEHSYVARLMGDGSLPVRGVVIVGDAKDPKWGPPAECAGASERICFTR